MTSGLVLAFAAVLLSSVVATGVGLVVYDRQASPEERVLDDGEYERSFAEE